MLCSWHDDTSRRPWHIRMAMDSFWHWTGINPDALMSALLRYGVGEQFARLVKNIYCDRRFRVADCREPSSEKPQLAGISQGCPLSPFLFIVLMTVVIADSVRELDAEAQAAFQQGRLAVQLYADDTLLLGDCAANIQNQLDSITSVGSRYGLTLRPSKFQLLRIRCSEELYGPDRWEGHFRFRVHDLPGIAAAL